MTIDERNPPVASFKLSLWPIECVRWAGTPNSIYFPYRCLSFRLMYLFMNKGLIVPHAHVPSESAKQKGLCPCKVIVVASDGIYKVDIGSTVHS